MIIIILPALMMMRYLVVFSYSFSFSIIFEKVVETFWRPSITYIHTIKDQVEFVLCILYTIYKIFCIAYIHVHYSRSRRNNVQKHAVIILFRIILVLFIINMSMIIYTIKSKDQQILFVDKKSKYYGFGWWYSQDADEVINLHS